MPIVANAEYELGLFVAEHLHDAVDCYEVREIPFRGAELLLTHEGIDYVLRIESKGALPDE